MQRAVAEENAKASMAPDLARAAMYEGNPRYTELQRVQAVAAAYKQTGKFVVLPAGTDPYIFIGGENVPLTVPAPTPTTRRPWRMSALLLVLVIASFIVGVLVGALWVRDAHRAAMRDLAWFRSTFLRETGDSPIFGKVDRGGARVTL